jgi:hypothetical protein
MYLKLCCALLEMMALVVRFSHWLEHIRIFSFGKHRVIHVVVSLQTLSQIHKALGQQQRHKLDRFSCQKHVKVQCDSRFT